MQLAPIPRDEAQRLDAVHRLQILDSAAEERFDRITRIAHNLFDVPSVFISLVDKDRIWFKSKYGCDEAEESRDISFCGHTISNIVTQDISSRLFEIIDAQKDDRFYNNPVIEKYKVRFYLGFVLRSKDNFNIGTFCMIDTRQRAFSESQKKMFMDLGLMAEAELNNHQLNLQNNVTNYEINREVIDEEYSDKLLKISNAMETIHRELNDSLKRQGINYKEWSILNEIAQTESVSPRSVSKNLGIAPPTMTKNLDTLETKQFIKRCYPKEGDRRFVHLVCNEQGKDAWCKGRKITNRLAKMQLQSLVRLMVE